MVAFIEGLKDYSLEQIAHGFEKCLKEVPKMPTVADVRSKGMFTKSFDEMQEDLKADEMYEKTMTWARVNYSPDLKGKTGTCEELPPICEHAMLHAGGIVLFMSDEPTTKSITKLRFCEMYKKAYRTFKQRGGKTREEAKQMLEEFKTSEIYQLPEQKQIEG